MLLQQLVGGLMDVIGSFVMISLITPLFLAVCGVLVVVYSFILRYVLRSTREIKRILDLIRAPLFGVYAELNSGNNFLKNIPKTNKFLFDFLINLSCLNTFFNPFSLSRLNLDSQSQQGEIFLFNV